MGYYKKRNNIIPLERLNPEIASTRITYINTLFDSVEFAIRHILYNTFYLISSAIDPFPYNTEAVYIYRKNFHVELFSIGNGKPRSKF